MLKCPNVMHFGLGQLGIQYTPEAFVEAAKNGDIVAVKLFLTAGIDPNTKSTHPYRTALIGATSGGHIDIMQALLDRGADINVKVPNSEMTLLTTEARHGHANIVQFLLNKGAKDENSAALFIAILNGRTAVVKTFLDNGADINAKDEKGRTALRQAREGGWTEITDLLTQAGAKE